MRPVIRVTNLSKRYHLDGLHPAHATFREALAGALFRPFRRPQERPRTGDGTVWALKEINLEIAPGEVVGLIGNNGAGKSTLLKILSKVTVPTIGRTEVYGKIGSLLELGTGFHPDLTGRENIFLHSTILGLKRAEIKKRLEPIIAFAEIGEFVDTQVKWYSTGMYLRLAFSVAIHLDAEVLFMDEVLAVGDTGFQQKCLNKLHEIKKQGRTILFVSHSMAAITRLCQRVVWLEDGRLREDGPASPVVNSYLSKSWNIMSVREWPNLQEAPGNKIVRLCRVGVRDEEGRAVEMTDRRAPAGIEVTFEVLQPGQVLMPRIDLFSDTGVHLFVALDDDPAWKNRPRAPGRYVSTAWIPGDLLAEGNLVIHVSLLSPAPTPALHAQVFNAITFRVIDPQSRGVVQADFVGPFSGLIRPALTWTTDFESHPAARTVEPGRAAADASSRFVK